MGGCHVGELLLHHKIRPGTFCSSGCLLVCFVCFFFKSPLKLRLYSPLWVQGVTLPFYNALLSMNSRGGGHVDLRNFKSCRPFLAPTPPWAVQCLVGTNVSLCHSDLLRFHVFVRFLWQNGKRFSFILGLVTCYYYIYDKLSFATLVKRAFLLIFFVLIFNRFLCNSAFNLIYCWLQSVDLMSTLFELCIF